MGEPTCLMQTHHQQQPFAYTLDLPNNEQPTEVRNPMHALGQSVSFGRFMTESLEWEKWSNFSHNRYVEEAERYSKPGSVAQKKAFFEAHYKNLAARKKAEAEAAAAAAEAAAAQLEQSQNENGQEDESNVVTIAVIDENKVDSVSEAVEEEKSGSKRDNVDQQETEQQNKAVEMEKSGSKGEKKINEQVSVQNTTTKKKKMTIASSSTCSSSSKASTTSKLSKKPSVVISSTPLSKKPLLDSGDKKRLTPKSLHMGVNFSPIREISRLKTTVIRKIDNSRFGSNSSKLNKDCPTPLKTPIKLPKNGTRQQQLLETPCSPNLRITTPLNPSASTTKPSRPKWHSLATENKTRSPFSSTPFSFRTEERAEKRKEKLEERFNANEAQEVIPKTKVKDKPETETGKLRPNLCFKARPLPNFYKLRKAQKDETIEVSVTHPQSPKLVNNKNKAKVGTKGSQTPNRLTVKSNNGSKHFHGKSGSLISRPKRTTTITHENTSPNILFGNK